MYHLPRAIVAGLIGAGLVSAQYRYADNQAGLEKDRDHVAANFPEVDTELFSPAFLNPELIPATFSNGTAGPTSQKAMGE